MHVQFYVVRSKDGSASDRTREFSEAMAVKCFGLLKRTEKIDPTAPLPNRTSLVACRTKGCETAVKISSFALWRFGRGEIPDPARECIRCIEDRPAKSETVKNELVGKPINLDAFARHLVSSVIALERLVFADDDSAEHAAYFALGQLDRDADKMMRDISRLIDIVGRKSAWQQIDEARKSAGTLEMASRWEAATTSEPDCSPASEPEIQKERPHETPTSTTTEPPTKTQDVAESWIF